METMRNSPEHCRCVGMLMAVMAICWLPANAAPVPEADRVGIDLRRTTLVVRDVDRSLHFYRDALGMEVIYDQRLRTPSDANSDEMANRVSRLVLLRANDSFVGVLGLLEYVKPRKVAVSRGAEPFSVGSVVLVFNAKDLNGVFERAAAVRRVSVRQAPTLRTYPDYQSGARLEVLVSVLVDPDGFTVELNQLQSMPKAVAPDRS